MSRIPARARASICQTISGLPPAIVNAIVTAAPCTRLPRPTMTSVITACNTKNTIAAISPSDVDTRGGGEASGSSR